MTGSAPRRPLLEVMRATFGAATRPAQLAQTERYVAAALVRDTGTHAQAPGGHGVVAAAGGVDGSAAGAAAAGSSFLWSLAASTAPSLRLLALLKAPWASASRPLLLTPPALWQQRAMATQAGSPSALQAAAEQAPAHPAVGHAAASQLAAPQEAPTLQPRAQHAAAAHTAAVSSQRAASLAVEALLDEAAECNDAGELLDLLAEHQQHLRLQTGAGAEAGANTSADASSGPAVPSRVARQLLLRLAALPPPPPQPKATRDVQRRRREAATQLGAELEATYGTLTAEELLTLLEAVSRLGWVLGHCRTLPPALRPPAAAAAPPQAPPRAGNAGGSSKYGSIGGRTPATPATRDAPAPPASAAATAPAAAAHANAHPAAPLLHALLTRPECSASRSAPRSAAPSVLARALACAVRLRLQDEAALAALLPLLAARRAELAPSALATLLAAAAELGPRARAQVPWADVCGRLGGAGAVEALGDEALVALARTLTAAGSDAAAGGTGRRRRSIGEDGEREDDAWAGSGEEERQLAAAVWREAAGRARRGAFSGEQLVELAAAAEGMGLRDPSILLPCTAAGARQAAHLQPEQLASLVHNAARTGVAHPHLLSAAAAAVAAEPAAFAADPRSLVRIVWAAACLGKPCPSLFTEATAKMLLPAMSGQAHVGARRQEPRTHAGASSSSSGGDGGSGGSSVDSQAQAGAVAAGVSAATPASAGVTAAAAAAAVTPTGAAVELRPYELANAVWAFAREALREGTAHSALAGTGPSTTGSTAGDDAGARTALMRLVVQRSLEWDAAKRMPQHSLVRVLWSCTALGHVPQERDAGEGGGARRTDDGSSGGDSFAANRLTLAHRAAEVACEGKLTPEQLIEAAESLEPYFSPGGPLTEEYRGKVHARLVAVAKGSLGRLRPDARVSLLSALAATAPSPADIDSRLMLRLQQRLAPAMRAGLLSGVQLLAVLRVLSSANARTAPLLPMLEGQLLSLLPGGAAAAAVARAEDADPHAAREALRAEAAAEALLLLGRLQRDGTVLELFRGAHAAMASCLHRLPPATTARMLRVLGSACERQSAGAESRPPSAQAPYAHTRTPSRSAASVQAGAAEVLGPGRTAFLDAACAALAARLDELSAADLVGAAWGLAACACTRADTYDQLCARLTSSRCKSLPWWSLARLTDALHSGGHLQRHPELVERIAKQATRELASPGAGAKPEAVAQMAEVFAEAGPQYGGFFLAAAHQARRWQQQQQAQQEQHRRLRAQGGANASQPAAAGMGWLVERVRRACERAGYSVEEVLGTQRSAQRAGGASARRMGGSGRQLQ